MLGFSFLGLSNLVAQNNGCDEYFTYTVVNEDECLIEFEVTPPNTSENFSVTIVQDGGGTQTFTIENFVVVLPNSPVVVTFNQNDPINGNISCSETIHGNLCTQDCTGSLQLSICEPVEDRCYKSTGEVFFEDPNSTGDEFDIYSMEMRLKITEGNATFDMAETELVADMDGFNPTSDFTFFVAPTEIIFTIFCDSDDDAYQLPYGTCETAPLIRFVTNKIPNEDYVVEATITANVTGEGNCNSTIDPPENCFVSTFEPETLANSTNGINNCPNNDLLVTVEDSYLEPLTEDNPGKLEITISNTTNEPITVTQLDFTFNYMDVNGNIGSPEFNTPVSAIPTANGYYVTYPLFMIPANSDITILDLCIPPPAGPQNTYGKAILDFELIRVANGTECCTLPFTPQTFEYEFEGEEPCEEDSFNGKTVNLNLLPLPMGFPLTNECQTGFVASFSVLNELGGSSSIDLDELILRIGTETDGDLKISKIEPIPATTNSFCPSNNTATNSYPNMVEDHNCLGFSDFEAGWFFETNTTHTLNDGDAIGVIFDGTFGAITNIEVTEFSLKTTENETACIPNFIGIGGGSVLLPIESPCNFCSDLSLTANPITNTNTDEIGDCERGFSLALTTPTSKSFSRIYLDFNINEIGSNAFQVSETFALVCSSENTCTPTDCISSTASNIIYEYCIDPPLNELGNIELMDVVLAGAGAMEGITINEFIVEFADGSSCEPMDLTFMDDDLNLSIPQLTATLQVTPTSGSQPAPHDENNPIIYELLLQNAGDEDITIDGLDFSFTYQDVYGNLLFPDFTQPATPPTAVPTGNPNEFEYSVSEQLPITISANNNNAVPVLYFTVDPPMNNPYELGEAEISFSNIQVTIDNEICTYSLSNPNQTASFEGDLLCNSDNFDDKTVQVKIIPADDAGLQLRACEIAYDVIFEILDTDLELSPLGVQHLLLDIVTSSIANFPTGQMSISNAYLLPGTPCLSNNSCTTSGDCISFDDNTVYYEFCNSGGTAATLESGGGIRIIFDGYLSTLESIEIEQVQIQAVGETDDCIPSNDGLVTPMVESPCNYCADISIIALPVTNETSMGSCENGFSLQLMHPTISNFERILVDFDVISMGSTTLEIDRINSLLCPTSVSNCASFNNLNIEYEFSAANPEDIGVATTPLIDVILGGSGAMDGIVINQVIVEYSDPTNNTRFSCVPTTLALEDAFSLQLPAAATDCESKLISGNVTTENNEAVGGVTFKITESTGSSDACATPSNPECNIIFTSIDGSGCTGDYSETFECLESDFVITPSKDGCFRNGVSTFDMVRIRKHLLMDSPLGSQYKIIAADVNLSGNISTLDLVKMQQLILQINDDFGEDTKSWRFAKTDTALDEDLANPYSTNVPDFDECSLVEYNDVSSTPLQNFVGIKIGNVTNGEFDGCLECLESQQLIKPDDRNKSSVTIKIPNLNYMEIGQNFVFDISISGFKDLTAYQLGLFVNPQYIEIEDILPIGEREFYQDFNFGISQVESGFVRASWFNPSTKPVTLKNGTKILRVSGRIKKNIEYSKDIIQLRNDILKNIAFNDNGDEFPLSLEFNEDLSIINPQIEVITIPNPFEDQITFSIWSPANSEGNLKIWDFQGRQLQSKIVSLNHGWNNITINSASNWPKGILSYMIEIEESRSFGKIIKK